MAIRNDETIINSEPSIPKNLRVKNYYGYWSLLWEPPEDDHTSQKMLRYNISVTSDDLEENIYVSEAISLARGQTNVGNVNNNIECYFQTSIPITEKIKWKVCAIDTSLKSSPYSDEMACNSFKVYGYVRDSNKEGISNVKFKTPGLGTVNNITDINGYYEIYFSSGADGIIIPRKLDWRFNPEYITIDNLNADSRFDYEVIYNTSLKDLKVYPNPYMLNTNNQEITFDNCSIGTTIEIFNISGEKVFDEKTNRNVFIWNVVNNSGKQISSGTYIYVAKNNRGDIKCGKLTIIK